MQVKRKATATWRGTGKDGSGVLNSTNNFFNDTPYSAKSRFENEDGKLGTNPEELIAAAHAGCYTMALSFAITKEGFSPEKLETQAQVNLESVEGGFAITGITLHLSGKVPGMEKAKFMELAEGAKSGCPVSKALDAVPIKLEATFEAVEKV